MVSVPDTPGDTSAVRLIGEHVLARYPELSRELPPPPERMNYPVLRRPKGF